MDPGARQCSPLSPDPAGDLSEHFARMSCDITEEFSPGMYLKRKYHVAVIEGENRSEAQAMWAAIGTKHPAAVNLAIGHLFQIKGRKAKTTSDREGSGEVLGSEERSLRDLLGPNFIPVRFEWPKFRWAYEFYDEAIEEPSFANFTTFVACFLAGFKTRGMSSQHNQVGRVLRTCKELSGYTGQIPPWANLQFLTRLSMKPGRGAAAAAVYLLSTDRRDEYHEALTKGIMRPISNHFMSLFSKYQNFEERFKGQISRRDFALLSIPSVEAAAKAINKLVAARAKAHELDAEDEFWTARAICPGIFEYLSDPAVKEGETLIFYALCLAGGAYGMKEWSRFHSTAKKKKDIDDAHMGIVKTWVEDYVRQSRG